MPGFIGLCNLNNYGLIGWLDNSANWMLYAWWNTLKILCCMVDVWVSWGGECSECQASVGLVEVWGRGGEWRVPSKGTGSSFLTAGEWELARRETKIKRTFPVLQFYSQQFLDAIYFFSISSLKFYFRAKIKFVSISNYILWNHILSVFLKFLRGPGKALTFIFLPSLTFQWRINQW